MKFNLETLRLLSKAVYLLEAEATNMIVTCPDAADPEYASSLAKYRNELRAAQDLQTRLQIELMRKN